MLRQLRSSEGNIYALIFFPYAGAKLDLLYKHRHFIDNQFDLWSYSTDIQNIIPSIEQLSQSLASQLIANQGKKFIIVGYSFGAWLAKAVTQKISDIDQQRIKHLFLCASSLFHSEKRNPLRVSHLPSHLMLKHLNDTFGSPEETGIIAENQRCRMSIPLRYELAMMDYYRPRHHYVDVATTLMQETENFQIDLVNQWSKLFLLRESFLFDDGHFFCLHPQSLFWSKLNELALQFVKENISPPTTSVY
ncbi:MULTISPECIES: thioesterase domain-containing protein [unclassified Serratia (in: enterobacteria)]|uniref:thioesterase domain-containing protein n=1 Tax=unclassified Serratia (in: enterobacteria) TaxID=2647522 RepID=UPI003075FF78